jgi:hypothetical protein
MNLAKLDFVYLIPALLCNMALLCGVVPAVFCLDGTVFAYISIFIFLISLAFHIYILARWQRYRDSSPFAYAVVQPALHAIMLVFALMVGSTNLCVPRVNKMPAPDFIENEFPQNRDSVSEAVEDG